MNSLFVNTSKVIVLILNYNGKHLLDDSVSSYLANDYDNFEVVVIDNGSSDGTKEWVEKNYPNVFVLRTEINLGYSGGFNLGLKHAFKQIKADYVLITNNDVKADKFAITELVKLAKTDPMIGFVTGKVYFFDQPDVLQTVGKHEDPIRWNGEHIGGYEKDTGQYEQAGERVFADDIFTLVNREMYERTGGYDPIFAFQCEEYDWQARAKKLGFKIFYTPYAKIWHKDSATIGKRSAFKAFYDARNPMLVLLKHKPPTFFRRFFWHHFRQGVVRSSIVCLKRWRIGVAFAIWRGFASGLSWGIRHHAFTLRHFI